MGKIIVAGIGPGSKQDITPAVLGGSKVLMLETLLYQQVSVANDFVSASVIAFILIIMSFAANVLLKRLATARNRR
jgi:putative spermidine/putrescine transport system permease protein